MGLNPTILRQGRAFVFLLSPSAHPAVPRRPYRASGFVLGREARLQASPREGPESVPKAPFHCEREIGFTAHQRPLQSPGPGSIAVDRKRKFLLFDVRPLQTQTGEAAARLCTWAGSDCLQTSAPSSECRLLWERVLKATAQREQDSGADRGERDDL